MKKIIICFIAIVLMAFSLSSCGSPQKNIVGSWKYQSTVLGVVTETTYKFNDDGKGSMNAVVNVAFTYSLSEDSLYITTNLLGFENTEEYTFEFDGSKKLILTQGEETMILEKIS